MTTATKSRLKHKSLAVTEGPHRAPARSMLRAVGLTDEDMDKPFVAVGNLASDVTPCNVHLTRIAERVKEGVRDSGSVPFMFGTITVSDGISMGTEGMKGSLVSREVIADSIETITFAESMDGLIVVAACDKNMPGVMMAMARLNVPALFVYGGAILPGHFNGEDVNIQDMFEAVGAYSQGKMTLDDLLGMERVACPGEGACSGMFTANTMASAIEAMGMSIPGAASIPAVDPRGEDVAASAGRALMDMLERDVKPRDIMTRDAFENAIMVVLSMGGSTNAVLHLLAIAHEAGVPLEIDDFDRLSRVTPYLTDLRPGGRFVMSDLDKTGGVPVVMNELLKAGLLHGDAPDRHRQDHRGEPCRLRLAAGQQGRISRFVAAQPNGRPGYPEGEPGAGGRRDEGGGHQAPEAQRPRAGVRRRAGGVQRGHQRRDPARRRAGAALRRAEGRPRNAGDAGGDGRDHGPGAGRQRPAYDRRALLRGHARPDDRPRGPGGRRGRPHRPDRDGETITMDVESRQLDVNVPEEELERRRSQWSPPAPQYTTGVMAKYAKLVSTASKGAVTT